MVKYPQGITRCSACRVPLVDAAPGRPGDDLPEGNLVLLWSGDDLALQTALLEELKAAGVAYFNRPVSNYSLRAFPNRWPGNAAPPFGFEVSVLASDLQKAKAILERLEEQNGIGEKKG